MKNSPLHVVSIFLIFLLISCGDESNSTDTQDDSNSGVSECEDDNWYCVMEDSDYSKYSCSCSIFESEGESVEKCDTSSLSLEAICFSVTDISISCKCSAWGCINTSFGCACSLVEDEPIGDTCSGEICCLSNLPFCACSILECDEDQIEVDSCDATLIRSILLEGNGPDWGENQIIEQYTSTCSGLKSLSCQEEYNSNTNNNDNNGQSETGKDCAFEKKFSSQCKMETTDWRKDCDEDAENCDEDSYDSGSTYCGGGCCSTTYYKNIHWVDSCEEWMAD